MRITLELLDGTKHDVEADPATFGCLADRVAFERRFGMSAAVLAKVEQFVVDGVIVDHDGLADAVREEHLLFLAWREIGRRVSDVPEFDVVLEQAVALQFEGGLEPADTLAGEVQTDPPAPPSGG